MVLKESSFSNGEHVVWKLNELIYGLNKPLYNSIQNFRNLYLYLVFKRIAWINVYTKRLVWVKFASFLYMDDILLVTNDKDMLFEVK